ncbi:Binding-protein-dependent transport systems inner membrane component [Planctomycetales bacterium 10988]|nr:Binding-protein-dependent transport systems inner membrane component [Planctomycetales bacterium 10988]
MPSEINKEPSINSKGARWDRLPDTYNYEDLLGEAKKYKGVSLSQDAWKRLKKNKAAMAALSFLILISILAILTPFLPFQSPRNTQTELQFQGPQFSILSDQGLGLATLSGTAYEQRLDLLFGDKNAFDRMLIAGRVNLFGDACFASWCGRDELGRDVLARLFWGARVSLLVGLVAALVSLIIGVTYGAISGYQGGMIDNLMMRFVDVLYSVPFFFVVIFIITILNAPDIKSFMIENGIDRILIFFLVIGLVYWLTMARVVRGQILSLKEQQFIEAARTIGAGNTRIIFKHLIPNVFSIVIVYLTLTIPQVMLFEAFLSFLGLGVEPPDVSWGMLANDGVRAISPLKIYWWLVVYPGLMLAATLFALNFLGDGLRDALDPRMKNRS